MYLFLNIFMYVRYTSCCRSEESVATALQQAERSEKAFEVAFEMADAACRVRRRVAAVAAGDADEGPTGPIWKQIQNGMADKWSTE